MARYKDLDKLTDNMRPKVEDFLKDTEHLGVRLSETWRSDEQQMQDYNNGYSQLNGIPPNVSQHQLGKAVDIFFDPAVTGVDGIYNVPFSTWEEVGRIGKENGLDWGYAMWNWDKPHFQDDGSIYDSNSTPMNALEKDTIIPTISAMWSAIEVLEVSEERIKAQGYLHLANEELKGNN